VIIFCNIIELKDDMRYIGLIEKQYLHTQFCRMSLLDIILIFVIHEHRRDDNIKIGVK
jgi:hypothetical protein